MQVLKVYVRKHSYGAGPSLTSGGGRKLRTTCSLECSSVLRTLGIDVRGFWILPGKTVKGPSALAW